MSEIYVIGHINPDVDSIASAVGYAWLLRERDGKEVVAARAGAINPQTAWVLKRLNIEAPILITDASPRFESVTRRLDTASPDSPLRDAWAILSRTGGIAPLVGPEDEVPCGLITGLSLFNFLSNYVGLQPGKHELDIGKFLDLPCREACDSDVPRFKANTRIRDVINRILREEHNEFLIVDDSGAYLGVSRQREVLNPPRMQLILVDHNEPGQALGSLEDAELIEILDHHRLGNMSTHIPIRFSIDVVGSTSTLVSEKIEEEGLSSPPDIAGLLLAGLLSDTLNLTSPTTTERDKHAAERLGRWAFIRNSPLAGEKIETFGQQVLQAGIGISFHDPREIVSIDMKNYEAGGYKFAISQVEVTDMLQLTDKLEEIKGALRELRGRYGLDFAMLMVTDVVGNSSILLLENPPVVLDDLPYPPQQDGTRLAAGVVSRKKQLLPIVLGLLED